MNTMNMSFLARVVHTVGFEVFGVMIFTPFAVLILNENIWHIGILAIVISVIAMVWNLIYNYIFDSIESSFGQHRSRRSLLVRIMHAVLFELGLLVVTLPMVAYWLHMSLWKALLTDIGFVIFYLIYAFVYNYIFDKIYFGMIVSNKPCCS
ncbi:LysR family transcriptional regulator [Francisella halioticida]|uniref:LysR family transcriptional regulator n=1 Tax=Francisella halioticida TaxID=549298 RepID=A0ABN5AXN5_9GAMM|nr:PACE efflux transporter [Francisella halioticida]ASG67047.1 LysR family transcriptional regulator [Francisella halioticida]